MPEHSLWDIKIDFKPGKQSPNSHLYPLSHNELEALHEYIDEMLKTGKIRPSKGSAGAPVFFVPKTHGRGLRVVVDYRGLNAITIKDRYPLPLMSELMDRVGRAKWFTKLDLKNGYNLVRVASGHEWKTAFKTRYGAFEFTVTMKLDECSCCLPMVHESHSSRLH